MSQSTLAIRPSASLIVAAPIPTKNVLDKDDYDFRVLMLKRNGKSNFVHAHVFPGGIVDSFDHFSHWKSILSVSGQTQEELEEAQNTLTSKICAIRETFEESGLLLTNPPAHTVSGFLTDEWRNVVHKDPSQFKVMCEKYKIEPAVDKLTPFSNWITPTIEKRRYNTQFYLTVLGQTIEEEHKEIVEVSADGQETVQLDWFKPQQVIENWKNETVKLFPPQYYTMIELAKVLHHKDLLENAGINVFRTKSGQPIELLPQGNQTDPNDILAPKGSKVFLSLPGDHEYKATDTDTNSDGPKVKTGNLHRIYIEGPMASFKIVRNLDFDTKAKL
ncbi:hypothetical protein F4703DRAFT_1937008 [Phycomyces blakesleeanus]